MIKDMLEVQLIYFGKRAEGYESCNHASGRGKQHPRNEK